MPGLLMWISLSFLGGGVALIKSKRLSIPKLDDADSVNPEMFKDFSRGYAYGNISDYACYNDVIYFEYYTIPFDEYIKVQHASTTDYTDIVIYSY